MTSSLSERLEAARAAERVDAAGFDVDAEGNSEAVLEVCVLAAAGLAAPEDMLSDEAPKYYVAVSVKGDEQRTKASAGPSPHYPSSEPFSLAGVGPEAALRVTVKAEQRYVADAVVGRTTLPLLPLLASQAWQETTVSLQPLLESAGTGKPSGTVRLRLRLLYRRVARLEAQLAAAEAQAAADQVARVLCLSVGTKVSTPYGPGVIAKKRARDLSYEVELSWKLADGAAARAFLQADQVSAPQPDHLLPPPGAHVMTTYGAGTLEFVRRCDGMAVVTLDWELAGGLRARAFLHPDAVSTGYETAAAHLRRQQRAAALSGGAQRRAVEYRKGRRVKTPYGDGTVHEFRAESQSYAVKLARWTLSDGRAPMAYVQRADVQPLTVRPHELSLDEQLAVAAKHRQEGNQLFAGKEFGRAAEKYNMALSFLSCVGFNVPAQHQARLLGIQIPCFLNAAICYLRADQTAQAERSASEAAKLLDQLAQSRQGSLVAHMLLADDVTEELLFVKWPVKALSRRAAALKAAGELKRAKADLARALHLQPGNKTVRQELEAVGKLIKREKAKEKKTWAGVFDKANSPRRRPAGPAAAVPPAAAAAVPVAATPQPADNGAGDADGKEVVNNDTSWLPVVGAGLALAAGAAFLWRRSHR